MESYLLDELLPGVTAEFGLSAERQGLFGHSMGGHGALTLALRHPGRFASVSAFAPICAPSRCPWGHKAFTGYLGQDASTWLAHDASALMAKQAAAPYPAGILIDQGLADKFLAEQLYPEAFEAACAAVKQPLTLRRHAGYDHGYYFIATLVDDHPAPPRGATEMSPGLPPGRAPAPGTGAAAAGGPEAKALRTRRASAALAQAAARLSTDRYQPTTRRQRLVIVLVTLVVVVGLWGLLIFRPGGTYRDLAACSPGQLQGCVGGLAEVMLLAADRGCIGAGWLAGFWPVGGGAGRWRGVCRDVGGAGLCGLCGGGGFRSHDSGFTSAGQPSRALSLRLAGPLSLGTAESSAASKRHVLRRRARQRTGG